MCMHLNFSINQGCTGIRGKRTQIFFLGKLRHGLPFRLPPSRLNHSNLLCIILTFHENNPGAYETELFRYCDIVAEHTDNRLKEYWDTHIPTCWPGRDEYMSEEKLRNE